MSAQIVLLHIFVVEEFFEKAYKDYDIIIWSATEMVWVTWKMRNLKLDLEEPNANPFKITSLFCTYNKSNLSLIYYNNTTNLSFVFMNL